MIYESDYGISFQSENPIPEFPDFDRVVSWLRNTAASESKTVATLAYQFVTDEELLEMNKQFLQHDTFTDILTFPYEYDPIESDICISVDRVRENAIQHETTIEQELLRVIVHGLLHMCGYSDETAEEKQDMRRLEDQYLRRWSSED